MTECLTLVSRVQDAESSNLRPDKSYTALQTDRHCSTSAQVAVLPWRYIAEIGAASSFHASAYYGEYNERFGFVIHSNCYN